jgi:hypothetical protein
VHATWCPFAVIGLQQFAGMLALDAYRCGKSLKTLGFFPAGR